jgi:hypothetical protein
MMINDQPMFSGGSTTNQPLFWPDFLIWYDLVSSHRYLPGWWFQT